MSVNKSVEIVEAFWREVWQARNPGAAAGRVAKDFVITSGGLEIVGREAFVEWVTAFLQGIDAFQFNSIESFQNADGSRVASRWMFTGRNRGFLGGRDCGTPFEMRGTAILHVRPDGLLQHNWVERNALEVYREVIGL
ncbi:ester cyclase [Pseudomonas machongensis]